MQKDNQFWEISCHLKLDFESNSASQSLNFASDSTCLQLRLHTQNLDFAIDIASENLNLQVIVETQMQILHLRT